MHALRTDIQVLRAIAVLSVLIFHFDIPGLQKGFLGVDIFFVISGYLMSSVIMKDLDQQRFSISAFYLRRARRLLPAAFTMLAITAIVSPFVLTESLLQDYRQQLLGALSFSANVMLWQQSGYFDGQATLKPLLHTWSLALEEQYYFILPWILMLAGRRWRAPVVLSLLAASALWCPISLKTDPSGAFYLLPSRAWELLIGSACALPFVQERLTPMKRFDVAWISLPLMAWCVIIGLDAVHPRADAWLVCLATATLVIWPSRAVQSTRPWMRVLHWVGDRSYSLYLVHWPLMAWAKSVWLEGVPAHVSAALLLAAFAMAHLSYQWIEQRHRRDASWLSLIQRGKWVLVLLLVSGVWLITASHVEQSESSWATRLRPNYGFAPACDQESAFEPKPACRSSAQPRTLIWGDSYAMHLIPAFLASAPDGGIMQATRSSCAPLLSMARQMPTDPKDRAQRCLRFNESVLSYLARTPQIEYVVLSARWPYFFDDPIQDQHGQIVHPTPEMLADALRDTVSRLRQMHKKVVVMAPPASLGPHVDLGLCAERRALGLLTVMQSAAADCSFDQADYQQRQQASVSMLRAIEQHGETKVIWPEDATCQQGRCAAMIDGRPIYRDGGHLSVEGAQWLGQRLHLKTILIDQSH